RPSGLAPWSTCRRSAASSCALPPLAPSAHSRRPGCARRPDRKQVDEPPRRSDGRPEGDAARRLGLRPLLPSLPASFLPSAHALQGALASGFSAVEKTQGAASSTAADTVASLNTQIGELRTLNGAVLVLLLPSRFNLAKEQLNADEAQVAALL